MQFFFFDRIVHDGGELGSALRISLRHVAHIPYNAEIERAGGQMLAGAECGKGIHEGVAGCVGGLASVADDAGQGCEEDEEIEVRAVAVKIPGSLDAWLEHCDPVFRSGVFEGFVLVMRWGISQRYAVVVVNQSLTLRTITP